MNSQHFQIHTHSAGALSSVVLEDSASGARAVILPDHGALLNQFSIIPAGKEAARLEAVAGYNDKTDLDKNELLFYRSAKLSPFVCRTAGASYMIGNKRFEFPKKFADGSAIHGILSDKKFIVEKTATDEQMARLLLRHDYKGDNPGYPFPYSITVKYTLKKSGNLEINTTVENRSEEIIPIADGWHPYFSLGGRADDWELLLNCSEMLELDAKLVPSGERKAVSAFRTPEPIGGAILDNCYVVDPGRGEKPAAILRNPRNNVRLAFFPENSYPYLQIYTPDDRLSIAIENLSSAPDSFNNGIGLTRLKPGESQSFTVTYQLG